MGKPEQNVPTSPRQTLAISKDMYSNKKTSMEAVNDFPPRSLDFVYIDADHRFPFVAEDIYYWYWRVKRGGIIAGHDYSDTRPGEAHRSAQVQSVVDAFVKGFQCPQFIYFRPQ